MTSTTGDARTTAAGRLLTAGRFAALVYLHLLLWLCLWVLGPALVAQWQAMVIDSGSMGPTIRAGDVLLIAGWDGEPLTAGAVVTFEDPVRTGLLVTHRVVAANDDGTYATKGDRNQTADSVPLAAEQIRGTGRLVVPRIGLPVVWLRAGQWGPFAAWLLSVAAALALAPIGSKRREAAAPPARTQALVRTTAFALVPPPPAIVLVPMLPVTTATVPPPPRGAILVPPAPLWGRHPWATAAGAGHRLALPLPLGAAS